MLFGKTLIWGRFSGEPRWLLRSVESFFQEKTSDPAEKTLELRSFSGKTLVASEAELFRVSGYSNKAVRLGFEKAPDIDDVPQEESLVLPYHAHLAVQRKVGPTDFPDQCGVMWSSAISLTSYKNKLQLFSEENPPQFSSVLSAKSGLSKAEVPLYQLRSAAYRNFLIQGGLLILSY